MYSMMYMMLEWDQNYYFFLFFFCNDSDFVVQTEDHWTQNELPKDNGSSTQDAFDMNRNANRLKNRNANKSHYVWYLKKKRIFDFLKFYLFALKAFEKKIEKKKALMHKNERNIESMGSRIYMSVPRKFK